MIQEFGLWYLFEWIRFYILSYEPDKVVIGLEVVRWHINVINNTWSPEEGQNAPICGFLFCTEFNEANYEFTRKTVCHWQVLCYKLSRFHQFSFLHKEFNEANYEFTRKRVCHWQVLCYKPSNFQILIFFWLVHRFFWCKKPATIKSKNVQDLLVVKVKNILIHYLCYSK